MIPEEKLQNQSNPENDATERVEVDLNEIAEVEDATGDVNQAAKLPVRGIYPFKWKAGKDNHPYAEKTKGEQPRSFVGTALVGKLSDGGEFDGTLVFENHINSLVMRGKPTSKLHHFLNVVGAPAPNRTTIGELLEHTRQVLEQEPMGMAEVDWRAAYKDGDEWKEVAKTMTAFPKHKDEKGNWDGTYEQAIPSPLDGEPIQAQLYVRAYLTQAEANKKKAASA